MSRASKEVSDEQMAKTETRGDNEYFVSITYITISYQTNHLQIQNNSLWNQESNENLGNK